MYKGRLFTFGCSFTQYCWATWADLLGFEFEKFYNYGRSGAGNLFIACSIAEVFSRENISKDDTVLIMWTNVTREDRYTTNWICPGNIFTQNVYSKEFVEKFITIRGSYVRDMAQIYLVDKLLESTGCKYQFMSMVDINNHAQYTNEDSSDLIKDILELYKPTISKFKQSMHKVVFNHDWNSRPNVENFRNDNHPFPLEHIEYLQKVLPEYKLSASTIQFAEMQDKEIRDKFKERYCKNLYGTGESLNLEPWTKSSMASTCKRL